MQVRNQGKRNARRGAALIYAMLVAFSASAMVSVMMTLSISSTRTSETKRNATQTRYLAEAGVESAKQAVVDALANWRQVPQQGTVTAGGMNAQYNIVPTGFQSVVTEGSGIQTIVTGYELTATSQIDGHQMTAHRLMNAEATPIFQFAVFYTDDLEINPGPSMTLGGRVHSNANMYLNCGNTLTMNTNYVRAVGGIYRHRKDDPSQSQGNVTVRQYVEDPYDLSEPSVYHQMNSESQMAALGIAGTTGYDSNFTQGWDSNGDGDFDDPMDLYPWGPGALEYWSEPTGYAGNGGETIKSAAHNVGLAAVPHIGSIQMYEPDATTGTHYFDTATNEYLPAAAGAGTHSPGYYHSEADLSIITYADNTWKAFDGDGNDVSSQITGAVSSGMMFDARQADGLSNKIRLATLDIAALKTSAFGWPTNGLIYAAHYGSSQGFRAKGLQLTNGHELAAPLTVVSENSIYVKGDFNTINKKGAAVIGDAVNLLSNDWDNSKKKGSGLPVASETTYNVAIITGNQITKGSAYNGGLENLPRFHESWSGVKCNITGSFVNTWESQYATGDWKYGGDRYKAPIRNFAYDTAFNNVANLPPFTPLAVTGVDVAVW